MRCDALHQTANSFAGNAIAPIHNVEHVMTDCCDEHIPHYHPAPDARQWRDAVEAALSMAGQRSTVPRRAIVQWIANTRGPWSAERLVSEMQAQRGMSSRATVYRTIDWLREHGWLTRVHSDDSQQSYTRQQPGHHHTVICTTCGTTLTIGGCEIEAQLGQSLAGTDFEVHGHVLELYGVCGACRDQG
jgi:Fur family transcriptional regulator, ferric uptake regulator